MKLTNFDRRMFDQARLEAEKSEFERFNLGCVIAYKGHIIGRGRNGNKSHPRQKLYNRRYRKFNVSKGQAINDAIHAEVHAISSVRYVVGKDVDWSKASIYIYRICNGKPLGYGNAKPCPACMQAIRDLGIRHVYFTDDNGYSYLELN